MTKAPNKTTGANAGGRATPVAITDALGRSRRSDRTLYAACCRHESQAQ